MLLQLRTTSVLRSLTALAVPSRRSSSNDSSSSFVLRVRRQEEIKESESHCRAVLQDDRARFMLMHKGKPLLESGGRSIAWLKAAETASSSPSTDTTTFLPCSKDFVFLGLDPRDVDRPLFAVPTDQNQSEQQQHLPPGSSFTEMRSALFTQADPSDCKLLSRAWGLLQWHRKTLFCSSCGGRLERSFSGSHRRCSSSGGCQTLLYPGLSPVGIVLVAAPDGSSALLIRQPRYPPGMFSCVAGFVDVGESVEDCVRREVAEEVGMEVDEVSSVASQYWPFPAGKGNLMFGCVATTAKIVDGAAKLPEPVIDGKEVVEAKWFSPGELVEALKGPGKGIFVPPKIAIAHQLIKGWLVEHGHL